MTSKYEQYIAFVPDEPKAVDFEAFYAFGKAFGEAANAAITSLMRDRGVHMDSMTEAEAPPKKFKIGDRVRVNAIRATFDGWPLAQTLIPLPLNTTIRAKAATDGFDWVVADGGWVVLESDCTLLSTVESVSVATKVTVYGATCSSCNTYCEHAEAVDGFRCFACRTF